MKRKLGSFLVSEEFQLSLWSALLRKTIAMTRGIYRYSPDFLLDSQAIERPHYAYCMLNAARLARRMGHNRISVIEFGVAGGNGLRFMHDFASEVTRATGVEIECYGFDTGAGMPAPQGPKDLPYWFKAGQYQMDHAKLRACAPNAKIVLGDVATTRARFLKEYNPAPIGAICNDTDYWSSTAECFKLFEAASSRPQNFLPRIFMYMDDIIGTAIEMYGSYNGQLAAIAEFNASHEDAKISLNQNLLAKNHIKYRHQIYYVHLFAHPDYSKYIGGAEQATMEQNLKLSTSSSALPEPERWDLPQHGGISQ